MERPAGWEVEADPNLLRSRAAALARLDDPSLADLRDQAARITAGVFLQLRRRVVRMPIAAIALLVGSRADVSPDALLDAVIAAGERLVAGKRPILLDPQRRAGAVAGLPSVEVAANVRIGPHLGGGGWWLRAPLRLFGIDAIRLRVAILDRDDDRHVAALVAGTGEFKRVEPAFERMLASSQWASALTQQRQHRSTNGLW